MDQAFHYASNNSLETGTRQLLQNFGLFLCVFVWIFINNYYVPVKRIRSKVELSVRGKIVDISQRRPGERRLVLELESGERVMLFLADIPWESSRGCHPGAGFFGRVVVYPGSRQGLDGIAWPRKDFKCFPENSSGPVYSFPRAGDSLGVLLAASTGNGDLLSEDIRKLFRDLGISHLLVISGFHVGAVFAAVYYALKLILGLSPGLLCRLSVTRLALPLSFLVCLGFVVSIEAGVPAFRAILLLGLMVVVRMTGRKGNAVRSLLIAAIVISVFWPTSVFQASFLLSFSAVLGLIYCSRFVLVLKRRCLLPRSKILHYFCVSFMMCLSAWSFSSPFVLIYFRSLCPVSPFVNLLIAPVFSVFVIVLGGLVLLIFKLVPGLFIGVLESYLNILEQGLQFLWYLNSVLPFQGMSLSPPEIYFSLCLLLSFNTFLILKSGGQIRE